MYTPLWAYLACSRVNFTFTFLPVLMILLIVTIRTRGSKMRVGLDVGKTTLSKHKVNN